MKFLFPLLLLSRCALAEQVVPPCGPYLDYYHQTVAAGYDDVMYAPNNPGDGVMVMFVNPETKEWILALEKDPEMCPLHHGNRYRYTGLERLQ